VWVPIDDGWRSRHPQFSIIAVSTQRAMWPRTRSSVKWSILGLGRRSRVDTEPVRVRDAQNSVLITC